MLRQLLEGLPVNISDSATTRWVLRRAPASWRRGALGAARRSPWCCVSETAEAVWW